MWLWKRNHRLLSAGRQAVLLHWVVMLAAAGCSGGDGAERVPLYGKVTVAGTPVGRGTISLLPAEGHSGPAATTVIEEGHYEFTKSDGPVAGPHQIVVMLQSDDKASPMSRAAQPPGAARQPASPAKAPNRRWQLRFDVPKTGPLEHDVVLD